MARPKWQRVEVPRTDEELAEATDLLIARSERSSWGVADNFLEFSKRGWTQQRIAERFKYPQSSVSKYIACARNYSAPNNRLRFVVAYCEVDSTQPNWVDKGCVSVEWYTPPGWPPAKKTSSPCGAAATFGHELVGGRAPPAAVTTATG
jgi:hypothetical protein